MDPSSKFARVHRYAPHPSRSSRKGARRAKHCGHGNTDSVSRRHLAVAKVEW
jgi:hypothetical protein